MLDAGTVAAVVDGAAADPALDAAVAVTDRPAAVAHRRGAGRRAGARRAGRGMRGGRALHELVAAVPDAVSSTVPAAAVRNVNTPDDLSAAEAELG